MRESLQFEAAYLMLVPGKHLRLAVRDAADLAERFSLTVYHGTSLGALGGTYQNRGFCGGYRDAAIAGAVAVAAGPHSREARQIREVRLFPDLMGRSLRRPTFSMHSRGLENVYFPRVECWSGPAGCSRGLNAGLVRYIDEMVHHLRRTK